MSHFESFFGPTLADNQFSPVPTATALASADAVAIYFSAHWCPPCRNFTPKLAQTYKDLKAKGKNFEVVFVSSDKDQESFQEYAGLMPWLNLPFAERDLKGKLSKKYKVQGIPTLVILNKDGTTITVDGTTHVMKDPSGSQFPWAPPSFHEALGRDFVRNDGSVVSFDEIQDKVLGLYFSAHWCPPCRGFTPKLAEWYKKAQAKHGAKFEIVFVSSDRDEHSFKEYHAEMPWLALPYAARDKKEQLSELFGVEGIPTFVIVDAASGKVINASGRGIVVSDPEAENFPWSPKPVGDLVNPDGINDSTSLIVFAENADNDTKNALEAALTTLALRVRAEAEAAGDDLPLFFISREESDVGGRVRQLANLEESSDVRAMILDIPDDGGYYVQEGAVNAESLGAFWNAYTAKSLARKQLG